MQHQQFIIITGGVGVGKSTLISNLEKSIEKSERIFIKESIDYKPTEGKKMLEETLKGKGSIYDFQCFILKCFIEQFENSKGKKYILMERSPEDSLSIFCNESLKNGSLNLEEFEDLKRQTDDLYVKYGIPQYSNCVIYKIDTCQYSIKGVYEIVQQKIEECFINQKSCLFWLFCSDYKKQKENIEKRGRPEEKNYDIDYMIRINKEYERVLAKLV